jgi:hypothetical protein
MKNGSLSEGARARGNLKRQKPQWRTIGAGLCWAVLVAAWLPTPLSAKKKPPVVRSISGEVMDGSSNAIDGATVELTDLTTHKTIASYTLNGGRYSFGGLDPHHDYRLRAKFQNMVSKPRTASSLNPNNDIVINFTLAPVKQ